MNSMMKRFFLALGAAAILSTAPTAAHATTQTSDTSDTCSSCSYDGLIAALNNLTVEITQLDLLNNLDVDNVYVVDVDDVLNNSPFKILYFKNVLNKNYLNVILLQSVLSNFKVINNEGTLVDLEDFLNDADIDISDVVAVDVLNTNELVIFHK